MEASTEQLTETVSPETLLEKKNDENLAQKIGEEQYLVRLHENSVEVVDPDEEYVLHRYNSFDELEQDLDVYDPEASGMYGMFETEYGNFVLYGHRAGDNLIKSNTVVELSEEV